MSVTPNLCCDETKNRGTYTRVTEPFTFSFFSVTGWGIDSDYCDIEWFALEMNRDHSVILETASKYCISDSVDHDGYSIFF